MRRGTEDPTLRRRLANDGYCVVPDILSAEEIEALRQLARSAALTSTHEAGPPVQRILRTHTLSPALAELQHAERILDVLRRIYGHDIALHHAKLVVKQPGGGEVPWHQDFAYWTRDSEHPCQLNCMVYIDDADEDNGCLRVVPGSHRRGLAPHAASSAHGVFDKILDSADPARAISLPGKAGTGIFFDSLLLHRSGPNRTQRPRHSATLVYTNPLIDVHVDVIERFFPVERVQALSGNGPFGTCREYYQRRGLWQLAADHVAAPAWDWIEITDRTFNDGSFEWLSARKDPRSRYRRYEEHPLVASNRDDVEVRAGLLCDALGAIRGPVGLALLDCQRLENARLALRQLRPALREGSILVLDPFYDAPGWERGIHLAFQELVLEHGLGFDYLARGPQQVAVRITAGDPCRCPRVDWRSSIPGVQHG